MRQLTKFYAVACAILCSSLFGFSLGVVEASTRPLEAPVLVVIEVKEVVTPIIEERRVEPPRPLRIDVGMGMDITKLSGFTIQDYEKMLSGVYHQGLRDYSGIFVKIEEELGINGLYVLATVGLESGWGQYTSGVNNLVGMTSVNGGWKNYENPEDSIWDMAVMIKEWYIPDLGVELSNVVKRYCPDPNYGYVLIDIINELQERGLEDV